ncbi:lytic polysaccharide monooxygenase [Streptomyces montanisoli]|uniref:Lytic polysaccharide monooxygenase n=1 Tax=Streptomyces montanisoli TaxID=2798581 RepID=A0A940M7Y0_9ACTN|nr:lytic polysaccharide monooxygenase [Streptomyces montanisoli]MBP0455942.1 lytic polysaccharide monooxygenase [Streptomyces montanisoli]
MHLKRRLAAVIGVGIAPLVAVCLPATTASAHGYVSSPPSRQAQCAAGVVECGPIKYEPQSVEGPKGLTSCSGGNADYAELDDDSKNWTVTPVDSTTTFTWRLLARHATSNWQYFVAGQKVAQFNDGGAQPGATVTHQVNFGNITGRQKVLAVWNIADTANAFYACIDVNISGNGGGGGPTGPGACTAPAWDAGTVYTGGETVTRDDHTWRAKWWVTGEDPTTSGQWGAWADLGPCTTT